MESVQFYIEGAQTLAAMAAIYVLIAWPILLKKGKLMLASAFPSSSSPSKQEKEGDPTCN